MKENEAWVVEGVGFPGTKTVLMHLKAQQEINKESKT